MGDLATRACRFVSDSLAAAANPEKAVGMQAYMKTNMPFYGVRKAGRTPIMRTLFKEYVPTDREDYEELVLALWNLPHREEKYLALGVAGRHKRFIIPASMPLYQRLILEGAWWDLVDEVATHIVRHLVIEHPDRTWTRVDGWIDHDDMWLRRSAIICQVGAKGATDSDRLFAFCAARAFEEEFFIRKAIGWSLREYSKTNPQAVADFALAHRGALSGLSFREATKHIPGLVERP